jgi:hypothetical protein
MVGRGWVDRHRWYSSCKLGIPAGITQDAISLASGTRLLSGPDEAKSNLGHVISLSYRARAKQFNLIIPEEFSTIRQPLNECATVNCPPSHAINKQ